VKQPSTTDLLDNAIERLPPTSTHRALLTRVRNELTALRDASRACPCKHTTPCIPHCTCASPLSSAGCRRCCTYGSTTQQKLTAEILAAKDHVVSAAFNAALTRDLSRLTRVLEVLGQSVRAYLTSKA